MKKDIGTIKKDQPEIKNVISKINNTGRKDSRLDKAQDPISDLEDKVEKNTQAEQQKEKRILKKWAELKKHLRQHEV